MKTILFIDDNEDLRDASVEFLQFEGYSAVGANGGKEGVELALKLKPDLILCDIMMNDMNGYKVRELLKSIPETALTPFIFITALADKEEVRKGMELGADDYLIKPVLQQDLLNAITTRLNKSELFNHQINTKIEELRKIIAQTLPHEFKTPLNSILGFSDLIKQNADQLTTDEIKSMASIIEEGGNRLLDLVTKYLNYLSETTKINSDFVKMNSKINEVVAAYATKIAEKNQRDESLTLDMEEGLVCMGSGDLELITKELVDNAFKFSDKQSMVSIQGRARDDDYEITFTDHGIGFPSDSFLLTDIAAFNQFDRDKFEQQGSGLGLATTLLIIQRNNGNFHIVSDQSATSIIVTIPRVYE